MKTDDLITLLARGAGPAPRAVALRRLAPGAAAGVAGSVLLAALVLGFVPAALFAEPGLWFKMGYGAVLALAAGWLAARLARPLPRWQGPVWAVAAVLAVVLGAGAVDWLATPPGGRLQAVMGHSAMTCPWSVAALSLPALGAAFVALRGLAPARPAAAGAAAGLFAGAIGAFGYALACDELALPFVAVWYTAGIALVTLLGAWLGPRLLKW